MIRLRLFIFGAFAMFAMVPRLGWAATYEVGPGKQFQNLQAVAGSLLPGDVVTVFGGVTYPGGVSLNASGAPGGGVITIIGRRVNGARPILSGVSTPGAAVLRVFGSHYLIEGFELTARGNPQVARGFYNVGDDVTLRDSFVHDCPRNGIAGADASGSLTLENVEVGRCGNGLYSHQIYVGSSFAKYPDALFRMRGCYLHDGAGGNDVKSRVPRNDIRYNWIEGAAYHDLDLIGPDPKSQQMPPDAHCDADVIGNVLIVSAPAGGTVARFGTDGTASSRGRYRFAYNTVIIESARAAGFGLIWLSGEVDSVALWNNVFWRGGGAPKLVREDRGAAPILTGSGNWIPAGTSSTPAGWAMIRGSNPDFTKDPLQGFQPATGSPLIGAAVISGGIIAEAIPPIRTAAPPKPRVNNRDIGAIPFQAAK